MDRRALFFVGAAVVCGLMTPIADPSQRWVPIVVAIVYLLLALGSALDTYSRHHPRDRHDPQDPHDTA
jgi:hypothetical protein